jgi:hypothetical protein
MKGETRRVRNGITIDGANLDAKKLTEKDSRCPITGMLIYSELKNMQSDSWSFPGTTLFKEDNSKTYEHILCYQFGYVRLLSTECIPELG